jgi:hypothetical protein
MIRSLQLTDVAVLLLFLGKSPVNEARTRDRFIYREKRSLSVFPLLKNCLVSRSKRHSLVYAHRGSILGLACLRRCSGPSVWEIEHLLLAPGHEECCIDLLERSGLTIDEIAVERLFLRIDSDCHLVDMARQAGFSHYLTESLYCWEGAYQSELLEESPGLRSGSSADEYNLFRLYSATVPVGVRSVEGMTFQEWRQGRDRTICRESVLENAGEISAWLRTRTEGVAGQFDVVTTLGATDLGQLVNSSISLLKGKHPIYCLVPEFQQHLREILEEQGFRQVAEYSCFSKQLAVRVRDPQMVPIQA